VGLTIERAGFVYGRGTAYAERALEDVSLDVERGSLAVVLGETGSGKSTLLRLAAGLLDPTEGTVRVDAEDPSRGDPCGAGVGLVFQRPEAQLFAETVADDVAFGPRNLGMRADEARKAAEAALREVGLDEAAFGPRSPFTLSGGEARRVALAGVLAMRPAYLLLDEPTAGLDAAGRAAVLDVVLRLRAKSGIVVVTHDAEEFLPQADTVLVLSAGRSVFRGSTAELLADPLPLAAAGLEVPPVLRVQQLALEAGAQLPFLTLDPALAADALAAAPGRRA
jgi:energy-coupling factor transport system ATP-binding protein